MERSPRSRRRSECHVSDATPTLLTKVSTEEELAISEFDLNGHDKVRTRGTDELEPMNVVLSL
jgi:hypothetical protein